MEDQFVGFQVCGRLIRSNGIQDGLFVIGISNGLKQLDKGTLSSCDFRLLFQSIVVVVFGRQRFSNKIDLVGSVVHSRLLGRQIGRHGILMRFGLVLLSIQ